MSNRFRALPVAALPIAATLLHTTATAQEKLHYVNGQFGFSADIPADWAVMSCPTPDDTRSRSRSRSPGR